MTTSKKTILDIICDLGELIVGKSMIKAHQNLGKFMNINPYHEKIRKAYESRFIEYNMIKKERDYFQNIPYSA